MDITKKFRRLYKTLKKNNLEWICHQVIEEIKNGKKSNENGKSKRKDYTDKEKYSLLLKAYRAGVLEPLFIKKEIQNNHMKEIRNISFHGEEILEEKSINISKNKIYVNDVLKKHFEAIKYELDQLENKSNEKTKNGY